MLPLARAEGDLQSAGVRVAVLALLMLLAALVLGWSPLVPGALLLAGALYGAELAIDDAALDPASPLVAAGLLLVAELAFWSLEERERIPGEPGAGLRHASFVAALAVGAVIVAAAVVALVEFVHARGLALDLVGAAAAVGALAAVILATRRREPPGA